MATASDLVRSSLKLIGVLASGETPSAEELTDGLDVLRKMLDSLSTESLMLFSKTIETFPLVGGQQSYTMGVTGNFNTARPIRILKAATLNAGASPAQEIPIEIVNLDQWSEILQKSLTSTFSTKLYIDFQNPLMILNFWPIPTAVNSVVLYSDKPLIDPALPTTPITFPPGYELALQYNLAILLSPEYGKPIDPGIAAIAATTMANIQRLNIQPIYMKCDPAVVSRGHTWDWRTGE